MPAMSDFQRESKAFLRDLSKAAAWMMKRNVGAGTHWWRWPVLTERNPDKRKRPIFDEKTAQRIFEELIRRDLLREVHVPENPGVPAYLMRHDVKGWDEAVSGGRPIVGGWMKLKRDWLLYLLTFILGGILGKLEDRTMVLANRVLESIHSFFELMAP